MADTRLYELEECVSPQADDILFIEESATQTDKKVKLSSLMPTDAVESAVADWLTAHPEATTTVEDGSITPVKLATSTMDLFDAKANTAGEYDDMTVGNAKQLLSKGYTENKTPYIYRASAGGDRVYEKLIGGTVAWNQLVQNGNFADTSGWTSNNGNISVSNNIGTYTISLIGTTAYDNRLITPINYISGHKYLAKMSVKSSNSGATWSFTRTTSADGVSITCTNANTWYTDAKVFSASDNGTNAWLRCTNPTTLTINGTLDVKNVNLIDLTQLFGSTIADYIYSLEQSTAGAGVAYFRQMFPSDYYAYDTGSLQSVNVASKKVVGFNQWDEEWEVGGINFNTGEKVVGITQIRSKNQIKILSDKDYYLNFWYNLGSQGVALCFYDSDNVFISGKVKWSSNLASSEIPSNARYLMFGARDARATYENDICINISNASKNGTYEPYEEHTYAFDSDLTLRGIPKLDANNNLYYDGDVYESDGTVTRKYGIVDLGSLSWAYEPSGTGGVDFGIMRATLQNPKLQGDLICTRYVGINTSTSYLKNDQIIISGTTAYPFLRVRDDAYTDAQTFKTAMSGVYLVYELATPTTESADTYINPQIVDADGTEEFVDYGVEQETRDVAVPVGHESKYMINLRAKIEDATMLPTLPTANGTYTLKCTVASGVPTLSWVAD